MEGRQILDASLIANEVVDVLVRRKKSGVLCKLDIEKECDNLDWDFLLKVMSKMGFGTKWTSWISGCISSATFFVMVNVSSSSFFRSSKCLR